MVVSGTDFKMSKKITCKHHLCGPKKNKQRDTTYPWDERYIYLHLVESYDIWMVNVDKYTSPMHPMDYLKIFGHQEK